MADSVIYSCLFTVLFFKTASSDIFISELNPSRNTIDSCTSECMKKVAIDSNSFGTSDSCSRGCRFYAIAQLLGGGQLLDKEATRETCKSSCQASYGENNLDSTSCATGCLISAPPDTQVPVLPELSWSLFNDDGETMQIFQGLLAEPDDVLTDPSLRNQVSKMESSLRLPEMRIRTLPVSQLKEEGWVGWWCGSGRGVPHCLAASLLLLLILLALWFGLSIEEPPHQHDKPAPPLPEKEPLV